VRIINEGSPSQGPFSVVEHPIVPPVSLPAGQSDPEATERVAAEHGLIEQLEQAPT
jgi:hypothetical protein